MQHAVTRRADDEDIIWDGSPLQGHRLRSRTRRIPLADLAALRAPIAARIIGRPNRVPVAAFSSSI